MTIILEMFDFIYYLITNTINTAIFNFFFYLFIVLVVIKFVRGAVCW